MATIADLLVKVGADTSDLRKELNATKRQINRAFGSQAMEFSQTALTALGGIGVGLAAVGAASVKSAAELQSVTTAFTNMLGSAEKASAFVGDLQNFAAKTPFEFNQVSKAAQKFLAFGFTAEQVIPTLTAVGDAAAGVGLGAEGIDRITLSLGQMAAKSKVQSDEMLQLTEAGIPAWKMLADAIGVSVPEAMDRVSKGMVDAGTGISALVAGMESKFSGMMEQQSHTIAGTWSTMMDGLEQSAAQIGLKLAESLNLTGIFQSIGDTLSNFAIAVGQSGIGEALRTAIPPEFQIAVVALGTALVGIAIPAIGLLVTNAMLIAAPFIAAISAAAPFIAAATAAASAVYALYQQGVGLSDVLEFMGVEVSGVSGLFDNFQGLLSAMGRAFSAFLNAAEPALIIFGSVCAGVFAGAMQVIGAFINFFVGVLDTIVSVATAIAGAYEWLFNCIDGVFDAIRGILSQMVESVLPDWANNGISVISGFVQGAIGWLNSLLSKIGETNAALSTAGNTGSKKEPEKSKPFEMPKYEQLKVQKPAGGAAGGGARSQGKSSNIESQAENVSKSINREWERMFSSKSATVDKWYNEELAALEKSRAANENYERDKTRLAEMYSQKRIEALAEERDREREIRSMASEAANDSTSASISLYDNKGAQELAQMQLDYEKAIDSIEGKWAKLSDSFAAMTEADKQTFLQALAEKGIAFEQQANGELGFTQEINQEKLAAYKEYEDGKLEYFAQCKDIEAGIEEAYNAVSLERLQEVLTEEAAMRLSNMEAEKSLMDTYQQAYLESHATMMELAANLSATALDGLSTAFTDILTGAQSAKNAFESLGKSMIKVIAQYFAQMAAGMIITALLGKQQNTKAAAETQAMATAAAGALAPAAWLKLVLTPSAGPVATGLLTAGVASSVGIGLAASSIGGVMGNGGGVNQYAEGGYFTKPLFGILGDAGDEVALPLNKAVFENIAQGITDASEDNSSQNVSATFNNYGDINNAADLDDLMDGFNDAVLAGLRGAR